MKFRFAFPVILLLISMLTLSFIAPKGWKTSGSAEDKYEMGLWKVGGHESQNCAVIRGNKKFYEGSDYGSLLQFVSSQRYLGKKIKMTGWMKTRGVEGWAGFYIRADKEGSKEPITFYNMSDRHITGNTVWTQYSLSLDIPLNASRIAFGARLHGPGTIWFDNITIEEIGESAVAASEVVCDTSIRRAPENLDFEQ